MYPCPYRARAWWGLHLLADSTDAVYLEEPDHAPALYFPIGDVKLDLLRDQGTTSSDEYKGTVRAWTLEPEMPRLESSSVLDWGGGERRSQGDNCLWSYDEAPPGLEVLSGMATFDDGLVRVEVVDALQGDDPRGSSVKRFPTWGDASHLIDILDVQPSGDGGYKSAFRTSHRRPVVEGSQMLGQAIVAAGRHAPGRHVVSGHMLFVRAADAGAPLQFEIDEQSRGRTFSSLGVHVSQGGRRCASGIFLLDVGAEDVIRHHAPAPQTPGPYESEPYDMSVTGRDIRVVDGAYTDDPDAAVGPPVIDAWVRFRDVPDDPYLHAGLLAQFTGHMSIAAALRSHEGIGQREAHRTLSTAINAIGISFHQPVRADQWMLYRHESIFAGNGMTRSACGVYDESGGLIATFSVDAMVRKFAPTPGGVDDRRAL